MSVEMRKKKENSHLLDEIKEHVFKIKKFSSGRIGQDGMVALT